MANRFSRDVWAFGPAGLDDARTRRARASVVALVGAFVLLTAPMALAATLETSVDLSTDVNVPTEVSVGGNLFTIYVTAGGNQPQAGDFSVTTVYNMANDGTITPSAAAGDQVALVLSQNDFGNGTNQDCTSAPRPLGCVLNPFVIQATLNVAVGTSPGTIGVLTVAHSGSQGVTADATPATGQVIVVGGCQDEYTASFLRPIDMNGVLNGAKNGRVVPVKITVYDECAEEFITDPDAVVKIIVGKWNDGAPSTIDPVESYASAGSANDGIRFRWSDDGFWIYNLSTKDFGLGNFQISVKVDAALADGEALLGITK